MAGEWDLDDMPDSGPSASGGPGPISEPAASPPAASEPPPVSEPSPGLGQAQAGSGTPSGSSGTPGSATSAAGTSAESMRHDADSIQYLRDVIQRRGFALPENISSDEDALDHLLRAATAAATGQQTDLYSQLGRQLAPHVAGIQEYLKQQQDTQKLGAPQPRPSWQPPTFDRRWLPLVERHPETGVFVGKPGTPESVVKAVNDYAEWHEQYTTDPASVIGPMVEARAKEIATAQIEARFQEIQNQSAISQIQAEVTPWLYQNDQAGRPLYDFQGKRQLTPAGVRYTQHLRSLHEAGIKDPRTQHILAQQLLERDLYDAQARAAQQGAAHAAAAGSPQAQAQAASANRNPGQALSALSRDRLGPQAGTTEPSARGLSLTEMMMQAAKAEGITDADFSPERMLG